jgi:hypothetical protein
MRNENEKSAEYSRICPFCDDEFVTTNPQKRYCCERHQRNAAKARYRTRHTEPATCKGCDTSFEADHYWRSSAGLLQYETRSAEYRKRPDILRGVAEARAARA